MMKRSLSTFAWFLSAWFAYEIAWSLSGVPRILGPVLALGIAAFIAVDPARLFWAPTGRTESRSGSMSGAITARS